MRYRWNEAGDAIVEFSDEGDATGRTIPKTSALFERLTNPPSYPEIVSEDPETGEVTVIPAEPGDPPIAIEDFVPPAAPAEAAPGPVQASALRIALRRADLFDMVAEAIAGSDDAELKDRWEYSTEFSAESPVVVFIGETLGLDAAELAALMRQAAEVVV